MVVFTSNSCHPSAAGFSGPLKSLVEGESRCGGNQLLECSVSAGAIAESRITLNLQVGIWKENSY